MSDQPDDSQKTEEPTGKRLSQARERGQVPTSRELNSWILLFTATVAIATLGPMLGSGLMDRVRRFVEAPHSLPMNSPETVGAVLFDLLFQITLLMSIPLGLFFVLAILTGIGQNGLVFAPKALEPKLDKLSPLTGVKRLVSGRNMVEFLKGIIKLILIGAVGTIILMPEAGRLDTLISLTPYMVLNEIKELTVEMMIGMLAVFFIFAAGDFAYQRYSNHKELMMTRQEVREEFKQTEGDPHIKAKLRQIRVERARQRMMQAVPKADVVITNPTHFAVALAYEPDTMQAPTVVAKGQDNIALKIREVAEENDVPIVENPPLARALHAGVEIDGTVPEEHYKAVAEIISYVWQLKGKMPGGRPRRP